METHTIDQVLRKHCNIFHTTYSSDTLPKILDSWWPLVIVVNTDSSTQPGKHWICMFFWQMRTRRVCDSFGQYPARVLERYMNKYCSVWSYNNKQLQSPILHFCDHYVIWFCVFKAQKYSLTELLRNVSSDTGLKDYLTHKFACTLIQLQ